MGSCDLPTRNKWRRKGMYCIRWNPACKKASNHPSTQNKQVPTATDVYTLTTRTPAPTVRQMVGLTGSRKTSNLTGELGRQCQYCSFCSSVVCLPLGVIKCICTCVWNLQHIVCCLDLKGPYFLWKYKQNGLSSWYILGTSSSIVIFLLSYTLLVGRITLE